MTAVAQPKPKGNPCDSCERPKPPCPPAAEQKPPKDLPGCPTTVDAIEKALGCAVDKVMNTHNRTEGFPKSAMKCLQAEIDALQPKATATPAPVATTAPAATAPTSSTATPANKAQLTADSEVDSDDE